MEFAGNPQQTKSLSACSTLAAASARDPISLPTLPDAILKLVLQLMLHAAPCLMGAVVN
jgi:hypothetical protein